MDIELELGSITGIIFARDSSKSILCLQVETQ
uniref:Uncharacterized protein n=1 Tax=Arundo donax TaxID=35708 RepID=A0A0A9H0R0_ARUDO